MKTELVYIDR